MERVGSAKFQGSSPRMRGARRRGYGVFPRARIIPADAGSTEQARAQAWDSGDHPRGCGEHENSTIVLADPPGSSPRMRGARQRSSHRASTPRIIPADAGSTANGPEEYARMRDHPRGCGEHPENENGIKQDLGSSPRMRGARAMWIRSFCRKRIIPADAGSTDQTGQMTEGVRDHPRGCGEHRL